MAFAHLMAITGVRIASKAVAKRPISCRPTVNRLVRHVQHCQENPQREETKAARILCRGAEMAAAVLKRAVCPQAIKPRPLRPPATKEGTLPFDA